MATLTSHTDGFTSASHRTKKKRKNQSYRSADSLTREEQFERARAVLASRRRILEEDVEWYKALTGQIIRFSDILRGRSRRDAAVETDRTDRRIRILCLGLGKISESREAQFQYVLLQDLVRGMQVAPDHVDLFDPMFTPIDMELIRQDGYTILSENKLGAHTFDPDIPTLAYLPHCPRELYEAFLRANWTRRSFVQRAITPHETLCTGESASDHLDKAATSKPGPSSVSQDGCDTGVARSGGCIMLANALVDYSVTVPSKKLEAEYPCIARIAPQLASITLSPLSTTHIAYNAFAALSYQYLNTDSMDNVDWNLPPLPVNPSREGAGEVLEGTIGKAGERKDIIERMEHIQIR